MKPKICKLDKSIKLEINVKRKKGHLCGKYTKKQSLVFKNTLLIGAPGGSVS